jgi:hypothetical protein
MPKSDETTPHLIQIAMCSTNIVRTVQFLSEGLGFVESGREGLWGPSIAQTQGLVDDAACIIWWLTGAQEFMQIEVFQHTDPVPAPLPADWRPSDLGWVRWGCAVPRFDETLACLEKMNVHPVAPPQDFGGRKRMAVRIPHVGTIVEIIEDEPRSESSGLPRVVYATLSVPDLSAARTFWTSALAAPECAPDTLHTRPMEELWGLGTAELSSYVLPMHDRFLELVEYKTPTPRARANYRLCDEGMQNIGIGFRRFELLRALADRMEQAGTRLEVPRKHEIDAPSGNYAMTPEGYSLEAIFVPTSWDDALGFKPITNGLKSRLSAR